MPGDKIDHIILLMMENRSFDHYLGALNKDPENRSDVNGYGPNDVENKPLPANRYLDAKPTDPPVEPWCMDPDEINQRIDFPDPPHEWEAVRVQWNEGAMDGFVSAYQQAYRQMVPEAERALLGKAPGVAYDLPYRVARAVMGYYTRKTLPVLYAMADQFTVCDNWFASFLGSTHPNRVFANAGHCGLVLHTGIGSVIAQKPHPVWDAWEDGNARGNKITWKAYLPHAEPLSTFLLWLGFYTAHEKNRGSFDGFLKDCEGGTLPMVTIVEPPYSVADDHPTHDPCRGQAFLRLVVDALRTSPCWDRAALILTYDEHGGFFDHVPPPARQPMADKPLDRLGMRVPALVIGPYAKPKAAVHTLFDHRSILKTIAERWNLDLPDLSQWSSGSWDYVESLWGTCFDFSQQPLAGGDVKVPVVQADWSVQLTAAGELPKRSDLAETFSQMAHLESANGLRMLAE